MQPPIIPFPNAAQLPLPSAEEVERFRGLYQEHIGVDLDSATAARTLADLAQFYFLTHGHERCPTSPPKSQLQKPRSSSPHKAVHD